MQEGADKEESVPFAVIEDVPSFPECKGGNEELKKCMQEKIMAHVIAIFNFKLGKELGLEQGTHKIYVMFKINKEGNITDVKAKASHQKLQDEGIRVVRSLPQMIPGKEKGKAVSVRYSLPISFNVE